MQGLPPATDLLARLDPLGADDEEGLQAELVPDLLSLPDPGGSPDTTVAEPTPSPGLSPLSPAEEAAPSAPAVVVPSPDPSPSPDESGSRSR